MPVLRRTADLPDQFVPGEFRLSIAQSAWARAGCLALRRQVFCQEQKLFPADDRDAIDDQAILLAASSCCFAHEDEVVGTVRIHAPAPGLWWGSRLAVARPYRRVGGLGAALIRLAVGTAKARGAQTFLAHVQAQNRPMFEALDWAVLDDVSVHERPHYLMQANLGAYESAGQAPVRLLSQIAA
jgi:putative N-acetyltransferase (TIGR04045 family)